MANTRSAEKQIRSSYRKWARNRYLKGQLRGAVRMLRSAIELGDYEQATTLMPRAASQLDKAAQKNLIHPNKAARLKSRLMQQINALRE